MNGRSGERQRERTEEWEDKKKKNRKGCNTGGWDKGRGREKEEADVKKGKMQEINEE